VAEWIPIGAAMAAAINFIGPAIRLELGEEGSHRGEVQGDVSSVCEPSFHFFSSVGNRT